MPGAMIALAAALTQPIFVCYAVRRGYGSSWDTISGGDKPSIETALFASQILYVVSLGATRISTGFFTANVLARDLRSIAISRGFTGLCATWTAAFMFAVALRGNLTAPWQTRNNSSPMWIRWVAVETSGFACDIAAAALVAYTVHGLQMARSKKIAVFALLNSRLVLGIPIGLRLYYIPRNVENYLPADLMSHVLIGTTIILASVTFIKPVLRPFDPSTFGSQASRSGLFRYTTEVNVSRNQYYELSAPRCSPKNVMKSEMDDEMPLTEAAVSTRPRAFAHVAHVEHDVGNCKASGKSISKTQSWNVSIADVR
ncbi:hypothetical protein B0A55_01092 [Friedmanniomyces simplex]|uniref:Rhodopsin domain-containing protein n=1 Tax=Friedmanniomyces simplex TaxID=329884 RepID=A0A4U0Y0C4_9PEZI|nr:hypothetical protein B0A55_01092 [Friedmanniomyces simplex]